MKFLVFKEPYPFNTSVVSALRTAILYGLFVFIFLYVFQPFGLGNYEHPNKILHLIGYGSVTFFCLSSSNILGWIVLPRIFNEKSWTVGKNILYTTWMFFYIGIGNLLYSHFMGFFHLNLETFLKFQTLTILVGIFPVSLITVFLYNKKLKEALQSASYLNHSMIKQDASNEEVLIPSKNQSENFKLKLENLLYAKAVENYIEFYLCDKENQLNKVIVRNTFKAMTDFFSKHANIEKCHRSYLINLDHVQSFEGNAQGLSITINESIQVPVSRSYVKSIKEKLSQK